MSIDWAAGFFAAEGSFHWALNGRRTARTARIDIGQKERALLDLLANEYAGRVYCDSHANVWRWYLLGKPAMHLHDKFLLAPVNLDWVTGFWEGDGSIVAGNGNQRTPRISFTNKDIPRLQRIQAVVGGRIGPVRTDKATNLYLDGHAARDCLKRMAPLVLSPRRRSQLRPYIVAVAEAQAIGWRGYRRTQSCANAGVTCVCSS